jgi:hypothetical protein
MDDNDYRNSILESFSVEYVEPLSAYESFLFWQISRRSGKKGLRIIRNDARRKQKKSPFSKIVSEREMCDFILKNQ